MRGATQEEVLLRMKSLVLALAIVMLGLNDKLSSEVLGTLLEEASRVMSLVAKLGPQALLPSVLRSGGSSKEKSQMTRPGQDSYVYTHLRSKDPIGSTTHLKARLWWSEPGTLGVPGRRQDVGGTIDVRDRRVQQRSTLVFSLTLEN